MDTFKYIKLENDDGSYSDAIPLSVDGDHVDINGTTLTNKLNEKANNTAVSTLSNEIAVQTARIDNLAQLDEGSTTGDAELIDGRTAATGTLYNNIGNAIRKELGSLFKSEFIKDYRSSLTNTGYWKNGSSNSTTGYKRSAKLSIPQGYNMLVGSGINVNGNIAIISFYNNSGTFLSEFTGDVSTNTENVGPVDFEIEIPIEARYMSFSAPVTEYNAHDGSVQFYLTVKPNETKGHTLTPYDKLFYQDSQVPEEWYDWDNIPANYILGYSEISANHMLHCPNENLRSGMLITLNYTYNSTHSTLQLFIPIMASYIRTYDFFYIRTFWDGSWGTWQEIGINAKIKEIADIANNVNNIGIFSENVCDSATIQQGYICWGSSDTYTIAEKSDFSTVLIPVVPGHTYIASRISYFASVYNSKKERIHKLNTETATNYSYTAEDGAAYLALSWRHSATPIGSYMVIKDSTMPSNYTPYGLINFTNRAKQKILDIVRATEDNKVLIPNDSYTIIGYLNKTTGALSTEVSSFRTTDWIEITNVGASLSGFAKGYNNNIACYAFYDENKTMIETFSQSNTGANYNEILPSNVKYIRLSRYGSDTDSNAVITYDKTVFLQTEIDELEDRIVEVEDAIEFVVDKNGLNDGEKHFTKLVDCLWVVQNTEGKKRVYIQDEVYDVLDELGGMEHILSYNTNDNTPYEDGVQPWIDNCELIGRGHVVLNFLITDGTPYTNYWLFSCLNVRGNIKIENIEIHSKNCRYCIHDESGANYPNTTRYYKNVRCYQCIGGESGGQAIGSGFSERTNVYFDNCYLEAKSHPWSCHANAGCSFSFNNTIYKCNSTSTTASLRISQNGSAIPLYASIANCYLNHPLEVRCENTSVEGVGETQIDIINTYIPSIKNSYATVNKQIVSYNTLDGTSSILLDYTNNS